LITRLELESERRLDEAGRLRLEIEVLTALSLRFAHDHGRPKLTCMLNVTTHLKSKLTQPFSEVAPLRLDDPEAADLAAATQMLRDFMAVRTVDSVAIRSLREIVAVSADRESLALAEDEAEEFLKSVVPRLRFLWETSPITNNSGHLELRTTGPSVNKLARAEADAVCLDLVETQGTASWRRVIRSLSGRPVGVRVRVLNLGEDASRDQQRALLIHELSSAVAESRYE
jgi:hypothetical protein